MGEPAAEKEPKQWTKHVPLPFPMLSTGIDNFEGALNTLLTKSKKEKYEKGKIPVNKGILKRTNDFSDVNPKRIDKYGGKKARTDLGETNPKNRVKQFNNAKTLSKMLIRMNGGVTPEAKPDWSTLKKETKEKRKERKIKKASAPLHEIREQALKLWEKLRHEKGDHSKTTNEIHNLLKTHLDKLVFTHEMSRVVQWLLHLGSAEVRASIIDELVPSVKAMVQSKYSRKCVMKMLKYGGKKSRQQVVGCFMGKVVKLMLNTLSGPVLEYAYTNAATSVQQNRMRQEFYSDLFKQSKDDTVKCLADVFRLMPELKEAHLSCTKAVLTKILDKKTHKFTLFYVVLNDYLQHCTKESKAELLESVRELLTDMPDTLAASEVGMQCVVMTTSKEKKELMKSLKGHIVALAKSKCNHKILLALFDCVDDRVLLGKIVLPELYNNLPELAADVYGRKVLGYLVVHRHKSLFANTELAALDRFMADSASKKEPATRRSELKAVMAPKLLDAIRSDAAFWMQGSQVALLTLAVVTSTECGAALSNVLSSLAELICDPSRTVTDGNTVYALIEHPGISWVLQSLLKHDFPPEGKCFPKVAAGKLRAETVEAWVKCNRGCFVLVHLMETDDERITEEVTQLLKPFAAQLEADKSNGAKHLLQKLAA